MDRWKRNRIIVSVLVLILGIVFSIFFSTIFHKILSSKQITNLTFPNLKDCIESIISSKQHFKLFLCFIVISVLASLGLYFSSDKAYQSELQKITPDIYTPIKAGQNQHGSARWLTDKEKEQVFNVFKLDSKDKDIRKLINEGYQDLKAKVGENNK